MASKMNKESQSYQVNQLIYSLGSKSEEILTTFQLRALDAAKYDIAKAKFDATKNVIYERAQFMRRVLNKLTALHSL